jgi:RimJ/RimL family protein N-acetyltransferase
MIFGSELVTHRLRVRPFEVADRDALVALFADPMVARYVDDGGALDEATAALWIIRSRENLARYGYGTGAVIEGSSGVLIGWAGFARPEGSAEEIIYGMARDSWSRGYGRELLDALVGFARDHRIDPVKATVHPENHASVHLLRSAGFRRIVGSTDEDARTHVYCRPSSHPNVDPK